MIDISILSDFNEHETPSIQKQNNMKSIDENQQSILLNINEEETNFP